MIIMQPDRYSAGIIAALKKRGMSLSAVSRNLGLVSSTLVNAFTRSLPKAEWLIDEALGVVPEQI